MTFLSLTAVLELFKRARHIRHLVEDRRKHALLVKTLRQRNDSLTAELQSRKDESATMPSPQLRDRDETVAIRGRSSRFSQLPADVTKLLHTMLAIDRLYNVDFKHTCTVVILKPLLIFPCSGFRYIYRREHQIHFQ